MTTNVMTQTQWTDDTGAFRVSMYQALFGWSVQTQVLGDVYTETFQRRADAEDAYAAEVAALAAPVAVAVDGDDYEPLTWDC